MAKKRFWVDLFACTPAAKSYLAYFLPACVLFIVLMAYLARNTDSIWDAGPLLTATALIAWMGFWATAKYKERRRKLTSLFDLIWITFGILALLTQSWKVFESLVARELAGETQILKYQKEALQTSAIRALQAIEPNADKYLGDKSLTPELKALAENDVRYLATTASFFSKSSKKPNYLSDAGAAAYEDISRLIEFREKTYDRILTLNKRLTDKGTPFWVSIFGSFLTAIALGLRLAKAISDAVEEW